MSNSMNLTIPTSEVTPGPEYSEEVNADLLAVAEHRHVEGEGQQVPVAGLDIDDDLSFGSHNATSLRTVRFTSQSAPLADPADLSCLSVVNGNLYFNNGSGSPIKITTGSALNASAIGGITGLAGTSGAVTYNSGTGTFTFTSDFDTAATLSAGPISIADTAAFADAITIRSPVALAAPYTITLPGALPVSTLPVTLSAAGLLAAAASGATAGAFPADPASPPGPVLTVNAGGLITASTNVAQPMVDIGGIEPNPTGDDSTGFGLCAAGGIIQVSGAWTTVSDPSTSTQRSFLLHTSPATNNSYAEVIGGAFNANLGAKPKLVWTSYLTTTNPGRWWQGMAQYAAGNQALSDNPSGNYVAFRFSSTTDTTWKAVTNTGASQTVVNTGVTVTSGNIYEFAIDATNYPTNIILSVRNLTAGGSWVSTTMTASLPPVTTRGYFYASGAAKSAATVAFGWGRVHQWVSL